MDGLYRWDMDWFRAIHLGWHSPALDLVFLAISVTGLGGLEALFALCLYPWPPLRRFIVPLVTTVAFSGFLVADGIKALIARDRPSLLLIAHPQEFVRYKSFVSGHTTTAFAFATMVLLMTLGTRQFRWGVLAMVWACAVGLSRIYRGVHWPSDVLAGACAGTLGSSLVYLLFAKKEWLDLSLDLGSRISDLGKSDDPRSTIHDP